VVSQLDGYDAPGPTGSAPVPIQGPRWQQGIERLFASFHVAGMRSVLLGSTPIPPRANPLCLAAHRGDLGRCASTVGSSVPPLVPFDRAASAASGVDYVDTVPWFCARLCTPIIDDLDVYYPSGLHISAPFATHLQDVLAESLDLPPPTTG
jgi:hypothetical protein